MGQCCKCGRETSHEYTYCTADVFSEQEVVTYENVEECSAFLCNRCAIFDSVIWCFVFFALQAAQFLVYMKSSSAWLFWFYLSIMTASFCFFLFRLIVMLLDRVRPAWIDAGFAERRVIRTLRKQNPDTAYLTLSEYEKRIGGITP